MNEILKRIRSAGDWLIWAQTKDDREAKEANTIGYTYKSFIGAIRNEYSSYTKRWSYYGVHWHSMQAAIALLEVYKLTKEDKYLESARRCGEFLLNLQVKEGEDKGLIIAEGKLGDKMVHSVAALAESLPGLYYLYQVTQDERFKDALISSAEWILRKSFLLGQGYKDIYDYRKKEFILDEKRVGACTVRPLIDERGMLLAYKLSEDKRFLDAFLDLAETLLRLEEPKGSGNWIGFTPNSKSEGYFHARHAWWWGYPLADAYMITGDERFFDCFSRACDWYVWAQNIDGGINYLTYTNGKKRSFDLCSSAVGCALIMWKRYEEIENDKRYEQAIRQGIEYLLKVQILNTEDKNLKGAFFESILPRDNSDRIDIYLRDLATIFAIRGLSCWVGQ